MKVHYDIQFQPTWHNLSCHIGNTFCTHVFMIGHFILNITKDAIPDAIGGGEQNYYINITWNSPV